MLTTKEITRRGLVHLALSTVAISQPLLALYGDNLAVFTTARFQGGVVVWFALVAVLVPPLAMTTIDVGLSLVASRVMPARAMVVHHALVFIGLWACAASVLHAVSLGHWVLDAALTASIAGLGLAGYLRISPVRAWLTWLWPLAPAVLALFVISAASLVWVPEAESVEAADSGDEPPGVLWIQLDEAPLFPLVNSRGEINAARFPGFAKLAASSTWYRNALAVSQHTAVAVPSMLSGLAPNYGKQPVAADYPRNVFALVRGTMPLDVVEEVTALCPQNDCVEASVATGNESVAPVAVERVGFGSFLRDAAIVLAHRVLPADLRDSLPAIDESWGNFGSGAGSGDSTSEIADVVDEDAIAEESAPTIGATREKPRGHAGRTAAIQAMVERAATTATPAFRFIHVLLPHRPWVLAPDQRKSQKMTADPRPDTIADRRRDNYQSHLNQYVAIDGVIGRMVDRLATSAAWSKMMVIVTADHGITFVPGQSYRDRVNPRNASTLDDIYRVPLFVKYPGQTAAIQDDCAASTIDLVPTIEATVGLRSGWTMDGVDLRTGCPTSREREVTWPDGATTMTAGAAEMAKRVAWYGRWVDSDGDVDAIYRTGPAGALVGTTVPVGAAPDRRFEWRLSNAAEFEAVGSAPFESVPTRAVGEIKAADAVPDDVEVLVAVDGVIVGEVREASGMRAGVWSHFSASLMSRLIGAGAHEVTLWSATPDGTSFALRPIR